jgi:transposase-like protein
MRRLDAPEIMLCPRCNQTAHSVVPASQASGSDIYRCDHCGHTWVWTADPAPSKRQKPSVR